MKKSTTNPSPAGATKRDRWLKIGAVGLALALAVSVTPLLSGTNGNAATSDGKFCVLATSGAGEVQGRSGMCLPGKPIEYYQVEQRASVTVQLSAKDAGKTAKYRILDEAGKVAEYDSSQLNKQGFTNFNLLVAGREVPVGSSQKEVQAAILTYSVELDIDGQTYKGTFESKRSRTDFYENGYSQTEMGAWTLDSSGWNWSLG
ncbi:hypothetical protein DEI97_014515 [Curtobacterium sp. MCLR17_032]|uniref:hypothetical protein n=1 Tax=Curtobacterium sp. MCLR17_032 TaxID=2175650 RepID=UPI0011B6FAF0|nr:hypothetical protein [Curtobacterium sp. MCLR17_032]WIE60951.1 hypothetical protein DEI97_014515 [Curtobacterium sp. MCLR17_032]